MLDLVLGDRNGIALDKPVARFTSFGVTCSAEARAHERAHLVGKLLGYMPEDTTQNEDTTHNNAARWFARGYLPPAMCRAI